MLDGPPLDARRRARHDAGDLLPRGGDRAAARRWHERPLPALDVRSGRRGRRSASLDRRRLLLRALGGGRRPRATPARPPPRHGRPHPESVRPWLRSLPVPRAPDRGARAHDAGRRARLALRRQRSDGRRLRGRRGGAPAPHPRSRAVAARAQLPRAARRRAPARALDATSELRLGRARSGRRPRRWRRACAQLHAQPVRGHARRDASALLPRRPAARVRLRGARLAERRARARRDPPPRIGRRGARRRGGVPALVSGEPLAALRPPPTLADRRQRRLPRRARAAGALAALLPRPRRRRARPAARVRGGARATVLGGGRAPEPRGERARRPRDRAVAARERRRPRAFVQATLAEEPVSHAAR